MKRALALAVVALFVGIAGFAQISGTWKGKINLLGTSPVPSLNYTALTLKYTIAGFELTSYSKFDSTGFVEQKFEISGTVGPADISGVMGFDPSVPAYAYTDISSSLTFGGVDITAKAFHGVYPYGVKYFDDTYDKGDLHVHYPPYYYTFSGVYSAACQTSPQTDSKLIFLTLSLSADPLSITSHFVDCCTGIEFFDIDLSLSDLSLCCGISYDMEIYFNKEGFQWVDFYISHLFDLCCGIYFNVDVMFGVDYKSVTLIPKWGGITNCVQVWGDVVQTDNEVAGLEIWGWMITCEFAECNKLTLITALDTTKFKKVGGKLVVTKYTKPYEEPYFKGDEFESLKIETCGAGCCGGNWSLAIETFFQPSGSLFGITRVVADASIPVMSNLSIDLSMEVPTNTLSIGWTFTF